MHAVILAAGRGSRLGTHTDNIPKGMVQLAGLPLLDWQHAALKAAGISNVTVVTGYLGNVIAEYGFQVIRNPDWDRANMVSSLACALEKISGPLLVSYSDIVYSQDAVCSLLKSSKALTITYDRFWFDLWRRRFNDPLSDAESFRLDEHSHVVEIGGPVSSVDEIEGQFMGLLKLDEPAREWIDRLFVANPEARLKLDTTGLLRQLITQGKSVCGVPVDGGWCEIDSLHDLTVAEEMVAEGNLTFPTDTDKGAS